MSHHVDADEPPYVRIRLTHGVEAFLGRLETGDRRASRETVILLGVALVHGSDRLTCEDVDELLLSAGYAPLRRGRAPA